MSGEGASIINDLEDAKDCLYVGKDCCVELKAQIAQLRGAINEAKALADSAYMIANQKIDRGERPAIVRDAVVVAEQRLNPPIQQAQGTANNALNQAFIAFGIAVSVQTALGGVIGRLGALAAQLTGLAAQVAGLLARVGILFTRVQALGVALAALAALIGSLMWLTGAVQSLQGRVSGLFFRVNSVERVAQTALRTAIGASESAADARRRADAAYEFANEALRRSNNAIIKAEDTIRRANEAVNKSNAAIFDANRAVGLANEAVNTANTAVEEANRAKRDAAAAKADANRAVEQANLARSEAGTAMSEARAARSEANAASQRANQAFEEANRAVQQANEASQKADRAIVEANAATQKANEAIARLQPLETQVQQTKSDLNGLEGSAKNGQITKTWSPRVWEPAITPANQYTQRLVQPLEVGLNNFERSYRENMEGIRRFQRRLNNFEQSYNQNLAGIRNFQGRIDNFEDAIERNRRGIQNMQAGTANPANLNNAVEQAVRNQVGNLPESIRTLPTRVGNLEASGAQINTRISNLENVNATTQTRINNQEVVNQQSNQILQNIQSQISSLPTTIPIAVGLTLPGILSRDNTFRQAIGEVSEAATCRTAQPSGCVGSRLGDINNTINNGNIANAAANTANGLALAGISRQITALSALVTTSFAVLNTAVTAISTAVGTVLTRLGAPIAGGLSGGLSRLSSFLGIDRVLNLLNFLATVHNAAMLSNGLKQTLLTTLSSVGNATGLLETSEGEAVDLNKVANQGIEMLMIRLFGAELWANIELTWRRYNKIYQAGANVINAVSSMFNAIGDAIETIAEHTGKIGNALKAAGQVRETAYQWFSEKVNAKNSRFITFQSSIGQATAFLSVINEVAENVVEGQEGYTEAVKATTEFRKQVADAEKNPGVENKAVKEEAERNKALSTTDPTGEDEKGLLSFLTDL